MQNSLCWVKKRSGMSLSTPSILCSADGTIGTHCSPLQTMCICVCIVKLTIPDPHMTVELVHWSTRCRHHRHSTGNIRYAFFFLIMMVWPAVPVLLSINVDQGRIDTQTYPVEHMHKGVEVPGEDES